MIKDVEMIFIKKQPEILAKADLNRITNFNVCQK